MPAKSFINKYHFDLKINAESNNAGTKATQDCKTILINNGFRDLSISFIKKWYLAPFNLIKLFTVFLYYSFLIPQGSLVAVQYPLKGINRFFKYFIHFLNLKGSKVFCIIHDIDSLRSIYNKNKINTEIKSLSAYNAVISHNSAMSNWLRNNGYEGYIEEIFLFDYLVPGFNLKKAKTPSDKIEVVFGGNLGRGSFLEKIISQNSYYLNLYGPNFNQDFSQKNAHTQWYGSFTPEKIVDEIKGDFGLIWDGESTDDITGLMGNYIKYNTPHKTSLYLVAGLPVIISKKAAIALFVEKNNIGICINSISDIKEGIISVDSDAYKLMKNNVSLIGNKLREGYYLSQAVNNIEHYFNATTSTAKSNKSASISN